MTENPDNSPRTVLVAVVMFFVLALSTAAAWWITQSRQGPSAAGAEILAQIRAKGLEACWTSEPAENFYIQRIDGNVVSWSVSLRRPQDDAYMGIELTVGTNEARSNWQLAANLSASLYQSRVTDGVHTGETTISYARGQLKVIRAVGQKSLAGTIAAPENYIPEDSKNLAVFEAIKQNRPASYRIIIDGEAFDKDGQIAFTHLNVAPLGSLKARCEMLLPDGGSSIETYEFNDKGEMLSADDGDGVTVKQATLGEVLREFPGAAEILERNGLISRQPAPTPT